VLESLCFATTPSFETEVFLELDIKAVRTRIILTNHMHYWIVIFTIHFYTFRTSKAVE
jgi:hypothetical protein